MNKNPMRDLYGLQEAQEHKMSSSLQAEIDEEIMKEASRVEAKNYEKAKKGREELQRAAIKNQKNTQEMRRQGEKISDAKKSALKVHENAQKAGEITEKIEKESHMFNVGVPFIGSIKKWFKKDKKEEEDIDEIKNRKDTNIDSASDTYFSYDADEDGEEYIPGQKKTDKELYRILGTVQQINKEAEVQRELGKKQTTDLKDIQKINDYSKKTVEKTDKDLKKGL